MSLIAGGLLAALSLLAACWVGLRIRARTGRTAGTSASPSDAFLIKPYLQMGNPPAAGGGESLEILWHAADEERDWQVEIICGRLLRRRSAAGLAWRRVALPGITPQRQYRALVTGLRAGQSFRYRVLLDGREVFSTGAAARKGAGEPYHFAVFGDLGKASPEQKKIAFLVGQAKPDFVVIPGDIVYQHGRFSRYRERFFDVYNADEAKPETGAPLIRSTLMVATPGNHDVAIPESRNVKNFDDYPDLYAYFIFWSLPLNGPAVTANGANSPSLAGEKSRQDSFLAAAGDRFPGMRNYSFDYGNAHWTVLDGNEYMDWTDGELRDWVESDLAAAQNATWRFVCFHQPGFSTNPKHREEQRMRLLAPIFEAGNVDVVFTGHSHCWERSYPLRFVPDPVTPGKLLYGKDTVPGKFQIDTTFDGRVNTTPDGIIYLVTGGGGGKLDWTGLENEPETWMPFTHRVVSDLHSFTLCNVNGKTLTVRQISGDGVELDRVTITK